MSEPVWKRLVEDLRAKGYQSTYLDRLRERLPAVTGRTDIATEILQEMAYSLGRAEDKVNVALLEVEVLGRAVDALVAKNAPLAEIKARTAAYNQRREEAAKAVWELRVHREALGFRNNEDLASYYPIPPKR